MKITDEKFQELMERAVDGAVGDDFGLACNVRPDDHVHVRRLGDVRDGLAGRVSVAIHTTTANAPAFIFIDAAEARQLAAVLLNVADELDGVTPLVFLPRQPDEA